MLTIICLIPCSTMLNLAVTAILKFRLGQSGVGFILVDVILYPSADSKIVCALLKFIGCHNKFCCS